MTEKVEIYSTSICTYCTMAKRLLDRKEIAYTEYLLDLEPLERDRMEQRCNGRSVPQIFINNQHIGGYSELAALENRKELDRMLEDD